VGFGSTGYQNNLLGLGREIYTSGTIFDTVGRVVSQTVKHPLKAASVVDTALDTAAVGAIAVGGTAACIAGTAGAASAACGAIAVTAGTAAVGGGYVTYREAKDFYEEGDE
jgi:hypothetical protein